MLPLLGAAAGHEFAPADATAPPVLLPPVASPAVPGAPPALILPPSSAPAMPIVPAALSPGVPPFALPTEPLAPNMPALAED
jgi:hypothetical protein